jgi:STE24 endopeptidase
MLDGRFTDAEIRAVAAHEVAHVARHHVWKGVAWFALLVVPGTAILAWLVGRRGDPGGVDAPALVPFALLAAFCLYLAALPVANAISRRYEREADWLALVATNDPGASASLVRTIAAEALVDPDPPAWSVVFLGTHPPSVERLAIALSFRSR